MNVVYLNPFVDAANQVLSAEVQATAERGSLALQRSALTAEEITVLISMIGDIQGVVLFGMSIQTGLEMVSRMMGQKCSEFDNLAQSGIAELGNVISGRASINLSQAGIQTNISPPTMVIGKGVQISTLDFPRIVVPLKTELGDLTVHLALREAQPGAQANVIPLSVS